MYDTLYGLLQPATTGCCDDPNHFDMCQCGSIVVVEKHNTVTTWMRNSDKNKKDKHTRLEVTEA
jgi:hypothetical protein